MNNKFLKLNKNKKKININLYNNVLLKKAYLNNKKFFNISKKKILKKNKFNLVKIYKAKRYLIKFPKFKLGYFFKKNNIKLYLRILKRKKVLLFPEFTSFNKIFVQNKAKLSILKNVFKIYINNYYYLNKLPIYTFKLVKKNKSEKIKKKLLKLNTHVKLSFFKYLLKLNFKKKNVTLKLNNTFFMFFNPKIVTTFFLIKKRKKINLNFLLFNNIKNKQNIMFNLLNISNTFLQNVSHLEINYKLQMAVVLPILNVKTIVYPAVFYLSLLGFLLNKY